MRPRRECATHNQQTYFLTSNTWERRSLFRNERWADLFLETLYHYRGKAYLLHDFVLMPDHFHLLITPLTSLERAVQFIKGGFSYRAKKELGSNMEVWQVGYSDHRIRNTEDFEKHKAYIFENPVKRGLCGLPQEYPYSPAHGGFELDLLPQGLKPLLNGSRNGASKAAPLQSNLEMSSGDLESRGDSEFDVEVRCKRRLSSEKKTASSVNTLNNAGKVHQL